MMSSMAPQSQTDPATAGFALRPWLVLTALAVLQALATVSVYTALGVNLPLMVHDERWTWAQAGLGFTVIGAFIGGSSFLPAMLIRKIGVRATLLFGAVMVASGLTLFGLTRGLALYLTASAFCGIGYQMMAQIPASHVLTALFRRRSSALGLYLTLSSGIGAAGPLAVLGGLRLFHNNWRMIWWSEAAIALAVGLVCALTMGGSAWLARASAALAAKAAAQPVRVRTGRHAPTAHSGKDWTVAEAIRTPQFYVLLAAWFGHVICLATTASFAMAHLTQRGVSPLVVGSMLTLEGVAGMVWRLVAGLLGDVVDAKYLLVFALASLVMGMGALSVAEGYVSLVVFAIGTGIGFTVTALAIMVLLRNYFGPAHNLEIFSTICTIGTVAALGPALGGMLRDRFGGFAITFELFAVLNSAVLLAAIFMRPPRRSSTAKVALIPSSAAELADAA